MNYVPAVQNRRSRSGHRYSVFGLSVLSDIPLPELFSCSGEGPADIEIVLESIPPISGDAGEGFVVEDDGSLLTVPGVARYLITNGARIAVEPDACGSERHVRLYLLGSALGAALHQRHLLPLHANAINVSGRAVAFMGVSGAGKSTMAAWFHDCGYAVLSDDVCVVTTAQGQQPIAQPGIPRLRLWRDALEAAGRSPADYELSFDDADKYNVPTRQMSCSGSIPLAAVYLLDDGKSAVSQQVITRLSGIDAMEALIANTYRGGYAHVLRGVPELIAACRSIATAVPIYAVKRKWGREHMETQLTELERHAVEVVTQSGN